MRPAGYDGFTDDAQAAMLAAPGYFAVWYTVKSIALVGAIGWICYYLGSTRKKPPLEGYRRRHR